jgi:hypothetical protein
MTQPRAADLLNQRARKTIGRDIRPALTLEHTGVSAETSLDAPPEPFPTVYVMDGEAPPPPSVQVQDLMLAEDVNLFSAHGSQGKTLVMCAAFMGIVLARPVFGTLDVNRRGPVLLSVPEDGQGFVRMTFDALSEGYGLSPNERAELADGIVMIPDDLLVNLTRDVGRLAATIESVGAVALGVDPLPNHLGGEDERDERIATLVGDSLRRRICRPLGVGVWLNHHNRKPGKDGAADIGVTAHDSRGSSGWSNSARLHFAITKRENRITLAGVKSNRLRPDIRHELDVAIEADPANPARWLSCRITDANAGTSSEALTPGVGRSLNANEQSALRCLDDSNEPGLRLSWSRWRDTSGLRPDTFRSVKERLIHAGIVAAVPTGKKARSGSPEFAYHITTDGKKALNSGWIHAA